MSDADDAIRSLRDALEHSPDNVPLRRHLAQLLTKAGRADEAETVLREALALAPQSEAVLVDLAEVFYRQGKGGEAEVLIESILKRPDPPANARVLDARLRLRGGDVGGAVRSYRRAIEEDPDVADPVLEIALGMDADEDDPEAEVVEGRIRMTADVGATADGPDVDIERPEVGFDGVGGMESVKEEIRLKIIHPLAHPEIYEAYGKKIGGGILMYGPPGCGKTHLARATAGEVEASFLSVGLHDVLDMWIGASERNLHQIFELARRKTPTVLFFDEVDALAARRADLQKSAGRQIINQFLAELDGIDQKNDGLLVLAATNAPWHLDAAFRRPGRFDRIIFVPPPDEPARASILSIHLEGKPAADVDVATVAKKTKDFSGADIAALVDTAIEHKLRAAMKSGVPEPLSTKDLLKAARRVKPSTREWFATAKNHALYSNEGGIYDDILDHLGLR